MFTLLQGPFFLTKSGAPVKRSCFDKTLQRCLCICGLDSKRYKGHSFRIGTATSAAERGLSGAQIRTLGRWNSNAFQKYIRSHSKCTLNICLPIFEQKYLLGLVLHFSTSYLVTRLLGLVAKHSLYLS